MNFANTDAQTAACVNELLYGIFADPAVPTSETDSTVKGGGGDQHFTSFLTVSSFVLQSQPARYVCHAHAGCDRVVTVHLT